MPYQRVRVQSSKKVLTYNFLHAGARFALEQAQASQEGSFYNCMSAIVLSAFCLEAYLNHIGEKHVSFWSKVERKLNPEEKLVVIADKLNFRVDYSRRPFQSLKPIYKFRNAIAHGRTEDLTGDEIQSIGENGRIKYPETDWEKECKVEIAKRWFDDVEKMIEQIHEKAEPKRHPFGMLFFSSASIEDP